MAGTIMGSGRLRLRGLCVEVGNAGETDIIAKHFELGNLSHRVLWPSSRVPP